MLTEKGSSNFFTRLIVVTKKKVCESKYTKAFTILVIFTTIICIILESIIVDAHLKIYNDLDHNSNINPEFLGTNLHNVSDEDRNYLIGIMLRRLKNENVFFILLSLFQLVLGIDAIVRQSAIQLIAHTMIQVLAVVFAAIQAGSTKKKDTLVESLKAADSPEVDWNFGLAFRNEIGLVSVLALISIAYIYLCYKLYKQFGWNNYKKIGADVNQQKRFRLAQLFLLNLKIDAFFQLVLCVFYTIVMSREGYYLLWEESHRKFISYIIHVVMTVLLIPGLLFARYGVIKENRTVMTTFIVAQVIMSVDFILVLVDSTYNQLAWVFWILAVCLAIIFSITTIILSVIVSGNFGKGLKPYMQRLFDSEQSKKEALNNGALLKTKDNNDWTIDGDDDYPTVYTKPNAA